MCSSDLMSSATQLNNHQPVEALNSIISKTSDLKRISSDVRDIDATDIEDAAAHFIQIKELNDKGIHGIKTNLAGFDNYLPAGVTPGQFGILLAYPAIGKSWLAIFMAVQAWRSGKVPLVISLEMTEKEVRNRVYTIMADGYFSHRKLSAGIIDVEGFENEVWSSFNYKKYSPEVMIVEHTEMGQYDDNFTKQLLQDLNYEIVHATPLNFIIAKKGLRK